MSKRVSALMVCSDAAACIAAVIPVPVIEHFLDDYNRNGRYTAFPTLGLEWQKLENPSLRRALGVPPTEKGVLIRHVEATSDAARVLRKGDVLLSFDGHAVAADGTVAFRVGERIGVSHLVSSKFAGDAAELRVWQAGAARTVRVTLGAPKRLVPVHTAGAPPSYYIMGGLVFTPVCVPYLRSEYGQHYDFDAPVKLLDKMLHGHAEAPDSQLVVLSQVLAADVNLGYEDTVNVAVVAVNGTPVRNLRHLVSLVEGCAEPFLRFDLDYHTLLILDAAAARAATPAILETHSIARQASADLADALAGGDGAAGKAAGKRKAGEAAAPAAAEAGGAEEAEAAAAPAPRRRPGGAGERKRVLIHTQ